MSYKSLSHSKWERKYHVVFTPKGRIEKWTSGNLYTSLILIIKADKNKYKYVGIPLTGVASTYIIPLDGGLSQNLK